MGRFPFMSIVLNPSLHLAVGQVGVGSLAGSANIVTRQVTRPLILPWIFIAT